ncbi:MAG: calcium/sodium antiporter [Muribaculaceae bacterium]|nr:calcium/sodium antiporter [Muribaculaceae bacterium]
MMDYLLLFLGLGLLLVGANYLVDASVAIAQRAKISNFIIGLTIVGIGTSAPELFISIQSALTGHGDIAMGNVLGSNIANVFLILGVTATILPFSIDKMQQRRDIPVGIGAAILVLLLANDSLIPGISENTMSRIDGIFLLLVFIVYMSFVILRKGKDPKQAIAEADEETKSQLAGKNVILLWIIAATSLGALLWGGNMFLDSAKSLAKTWGMSEAVISITIVAIGTSLPELITAIIAACKKNPQLALGNVIGSNVFNLLMILGVSSTVHSYNLENISIVDYSMAIVAAICIFITIYTFKKQKFDRIEGIFFLAIYIGYTVYLLMR